MCERSANNVVASGLEEARMRFLIILCLVMMLMNPGYTVELKHCSHIPVYLSVIKSST